MIEDLQNHEAYTILGVAPEISDSDLNKAYKAAAMRLHPDKGGNAEQFKAARAAYERILQTRQAQSSKEAETEAQEAKEDAKEEVEVKVKEDPDHAKPKKVSPRGVNSTEVSAEAVAEEVSVFAEAVAEEVVREDPEEELEEAPDTDTAEPQPEPPSAEVEEESDVLDSDALSELSGLSSEDDLDRLGAPVDAEAVVQAIPVESCSRQAEHALDGAEMCLKVARLAEEAACGTRSWQQLLRCGTHLLDSTHCVTQAASGVARCAVNVPSDLVPLLEKIKTASSGMTRAAVTATRDLMRCTEIISERGLKAAELSNRLLQQSKALADTLHSVSSASELSHLACRTMASTYKGLAGLARDTADACAAAAVMVGDAQQHAQSLKDQLDKLRSKAKAEEDKEREEDAEDKETADASEDENDESPQDRAASNRRLLLKLNGEVLELQREMRSLILGNPALMPEVDVGQKERIFCLVHDLLEQTRWTFEMLGLHGEQGPATWDEAMQETLEMLQAAAGWDSLASVSLEGRILRVAALVDGPLLAQMLQEVLLPSCFEGHPGEMGEEKHFSEAIRALCHGGARM